MDIVVLAELRLCRDDDVRGRWYEETVTGPPDISSNALTAT